MPRTMGDMTWFASLFAHAGRRAATAAHEVRRRATARWGAPPARPTRMGARTCTACGDLRAIIVRALQREGRCEARADGTVNLCYRAARGTAPPARRAAA